MDILIGMIIGMVIVLFVCGSCWLGYWYESRKHKQKDGSIISVRDEDRYYCPECNSIGDCADEDGCCTTCGVDCKIVGCRVVIQTIQPISVWKASHDINTCGMDATPKNADDDPDYQRKMMSE